MSKPKPRLDCILTLATDLGGQPSCFIPAYGDRPAQVVVVHQGSMKANLEEARRTLSRVDTRLKLRMFTTSVRKKT